MLFRPIKALFNAIFKFLLSAIILTGIYLVSTGNTQLLTNNLKHINSQNISNLAQQTITFLKNSGIIKIVDNNTAHNENSNTQNNSLQQDTNTNTDSQLPTPILTAAPTTFTLFYPNNKEPLYISYQSKIKTKSNIFTLSDYTPVKLNINVQEPVTLHCKILSSKSAKELGYMYKPSIGDYECLIFTFKEPTNTAFYMKNVKFPLDIIYMNSNLKVISVVHNAPPCKSNDCPLYFPPTAYRVVIEMKGGNWRKFVGK